MTEEFKSKYFNIDEYFKNVMEPLYWTKEEFVYALKILESLPLEKLKELTEKLGIKFPTSYKMDIEDYLSMIDEMDKNTLLVELKKLERGR
jgi:hypothetical protein